MYYFKMLKATKKQHALTATSSYLCGQYAAKKVSKCAIILHYLPRHDFFSMLKKCGKNLIYTHYVEFTPNFYYTKEK